MRPDIVPGAAFPDYELPDHTSTPRKLSEIQGDDPLILTLARGHYCPKEHQQHLELAANSAELSRLLHETVSALGELVSGASPTAADGAPPPVPGSGPLGPDLLEIATLQAEAEGVRVEDWLREAILTHAARDGADQAGRGGDHDGAGAWPG